MPRRSLLVASMLLLAGCGGAIAPGSGGNKVSSTKTDSAKDRPTDALPTEPPPLEKAIKDPIDELARESALKNVEKPMLDDGRASLVVSGKSGGDPPKPPPVAAAVVESPTPLGNGRLTQQQIAQILDKGGDVFGDCYNIGAGGANRDFRATISVKATIGPTGQVNAVDVLKSNANNPKVDACVAQAFRKVKFPAPADGAISVITFPITFNGLELVK